MDQQTVAVIVATYGDEELWNNIAQPALASIQNQTRQPNELIRVHADSISQARNQGIELAMSDWIICLDADDELDKSYIAAMLTSFGDIRQPSTLGVVNGVEDDFPVLIPKKPLIEGNYIVIGAMFNRSMALSVGGFRELTAFEDWDLWVRMAAAGAEITSCPEAIYRVNVRDNGRNQRNDSLYHSLKIEYSNMIGREKLFL